MARHINSTVVVSHQWFSPSEHMNGSGNSAKRKRRRTKIMIGLSNFFFHSIFLWHCNISFRWGFGITRYRGANEEEKKTVAESLLVLLRWRIFMACLASVCDAFNFSFKWSSRSFSSVMEIFNWLPVGLFRAKGESREKLKWNFSRNPSSLFVSTMRLENYTFLWPEHKRALMNIWTMFYAVRASFALCQVLKNFHARWMFANCNLIIRPLEEWYALRSPVVLIRYKFVSCFDTPTTA